MDDAGWSDRDPDYVAARVLGIVEGMSRDHWRSRPLAEVADELGHRLSTTGVAWSAEMIEPLARHIKDPHWSRKHPWQALGLGLRSHRRARDA